MFPWQVIPTIDMKMKFVTCTSQESSPQIRGNLLPKDVCQIWSLPSEASLWGEGLNPLCGSLQELLDIGNSIHWRHWNLDLAFSLHPRHYPNKTFSHLGWHRFVAVWSIFLKMCFFEIKSSIKVQIKRSNHENLCFEMHASFKSGKSMPKLLLWRKSCLSEMVISCQGWGTCDPQTLTSWYPISTTLRS